MNARVGLLGLVSTWLALGCAASERAGQSGATGGRAALAGAGSSGHGGSNASGGAGHGGVAGGQAGTLSAAGGAAAGSAGSLVSAGTTSAGAGGTAQSSAGEGGAAGGDDGSRKPLAMFVMFDRSYSMNECGDGSTGNPGAGGNGMLGLDCATASRWDLTSAALTQFFQDPATAGLRVALRFFPHDSPAPGCDGYVAQGSAGAPAIAPNCDVGACSMPLVDAAPLMSDPAPTDTHEAALVAAIAASAPPGPQAPNPQPGTPTSAALAGAERWAVEYGAAHPDEQPVVVLVTDGEPIGCETSAANIARLATDARTTAGVLTYAVGLTGSSESALELIADAGGTERALFVQDGSTVVADLLAALLAIRSGSP